MKEMKEIKELYTESDIETMRAAEKGRIPGKNRVAELISFAEKSGIKCIGIANCISLQKEANILKARLEDKFEVYSIDCKCGKIMGAELLHDETVKGVSCNPAGQAEFLAANNTELNVSFGLCVGHDVMFNMKSKAPTTTLVVKDREHKHNPFEEFINE